jgi:hypothetical protein
MEWLGNQSAWVNALAAREVWHALGVPDAMGFSQLGGHPHCQLPASQFGHVNAFVRTYLLGERTPGAGIVESDGVFARDLRPWVDWTTPDLSADPALNHPNKNRAITAPTSTSTEGQR